MDTFSDREIDEAFRKFLFVLGIAAIRKGGKEGVEDVRKKFGINTELPPHNSFIPVFCISAALMFVAIIESVFGLAARRTKASRSANWSGPRR
jgi:hypothetical protein